MQPKDITRLRHMVDHADEALQLTLDKTRVDLETDRVLGLALVRLLEIVGEAAARVSDEVRVKHPEVPWAPIIAMRNRLIHGYDVVDKDVLWNILRSDSPLLVRDLKRMIG